MFALSNSTIVALDMGGYSLHDQSTNEFLGYINLPLQDVYVDLSNDNFVYGFYSGNSNIYSNSQCYLATFDIAGNQVSVQPFSNCPNPSGDDINLLDVTNGNVTYQTSNSQFVVLTNGLVYTVSSLAATYGVALAFPIYSQNVLYVVSTVGLSQIVLETFQITTGDKTATSVLSVSGVAAKAGETGVIYSVNNLNGTSTIKVFNFTSQTTVSSTLVNSKVVSIVPVSLNDQGIESYLWVDNSQNVWLNYLTNDPVNVNYQNVGSVLAQATGSSQFLISSWDLGVQVNTIYSVANYAQTVVA